MGKTIFLGLLLFVAVALAMDTSLVDPLLAEKKISSVASNSKESSSSSSSSEDSKESSSSSSSSEDKNEDSSESIDDKKRMLCNVIVRATHDLYVYQHKPANEITTYLDIDCKNLESQELIEQCREIVAEDGAKIYKHVTNGVEMSQVCKMIEDSDEIDFDDEQSDECSSNGGDKCQCCQMKVKKRKMRFRFIVILMAKKRMSRCKRSPRPDRCRQWIRRKERRVLKRIDKICPYMVCKHLGYCDGKNNGASEPLVKSQIDTGINLPSVSLGLLNEKLDGLLAKDMCGQFKELEGLCVHVAASTDGHQYAMLYKAVLDNNTKWINNDLREQVRSVQANANADLCGTCKNIIQSSKDFYLQALEKARDALGNICERCPAKEKCQESYNKLIDNIKSYLDSLNPDEFCSMVHLCSSSSPIVLSSSKTDEECGTCIQRLQPRKDAALQAINRLSVYFTDLCPKLSIPQCQQFISEMVIEARSFINDVDVQGACSAMGFCEQNAAHDIDVYEQAFNEIIGKEVCSMMGPLEALCQQVVQGNSVQVQTINLNAVNIDDLFPDCENEETVDTATTGVCSDDKGKCQCCIKRAIQRKKCAKLRVAKFIRHMLQLCERCPARDKCKKHWEEKKAYWDDKIDKVCPKKVCIRMGYCEKVQTSSVCAYMGPFKQACEQALNVITPLFGKGNQQAVTVVTNPVIDQAKDNNEKQTAANKP